MAGTMPTKGPNRPFEVGDHIRVSMQMHGGNIVDATIKAIIETIGDRQYQINFGNDQTALIRERQIVKG
jgi:small-conductance mechanosensitive channel